jgi:hypothetical protein
VLLVLLMEALEMLLHLAHFYQQEVELLVQVLEEETLQLEVLEVITFALLAVVAVAVLVEMHLLSISLIDTTEALTLHLFKWIVALQLLVVVQALLVVLLLWELLTEDQEFSDLAVVAVVAMLVPLVPLLVLMVLLELLILAVAVVVRQVED